YFTLLTIFVLLLAGTENTDSKIVHLLHLLFWPIFFFAGMTVREINIAAYMLIVEQIYLTPLNRIKLRPIFMQLARNAPTLLITGLRGYLIAIVKLFLLVPGFNALVDHLLMAPVVVIEKLTGQAALVRARALTARVRPLAINIEVR